MCKFSKVGLFLSYVEENLFFHKCFSLKLREIPLSTPFHYIHICSAEVDSSEAIELKLICDALHDLVPFVQFKKREKHPWRSVNFSKVAG